MVLRLSGLIGLFIFCIVLAKTLGSASVYGGNGVNDDGAQAASTLTTSTNGVGIDRAKAATTKSSPTKNPNDNDMAERIRDFYGRAQGGQRNKKEIDEEVLKLQSEGRPVHWNTHDIHNSYKLTLIATHMRNLDSDFSLLFVHTLADQGKSENTVTYYTDRIDSADEKALRSSLVVARLIEGGKKMTPRFHVDSRSQYFFSLKPDRFAGTFGLRSPEGTYSLGPVREGAFDPLSILSTEDGQLDEKYEFEYERAIAGYTYTISVVPRLTDLETLVIEVKIREISSLITTSYILIYEQI